MQQVDFLGRQGGIFQHGDKVGVFNRVGVVRVKLFERRHREHRARVDVHDDDGAAVHDVVLVHRLAQILFDDRLHVGIDGQVQVAAVDRVVGFGAVVIDLIAPGILGADHPARRPGKRFLIRALKAVDALAVGVGEAEHRGQKRPERIAAGGAFLGIDFEYGLPLFLGVALVQGALDVGVFEHGVLGGQVNAAGNHLVFAFAVAELGSDRFGVAADELSQFLGRLVNKILVAGRRVCDDVPDRGASGQHGAGGVIDGAAGGRDLLVGKLLLGRADAVVFGVTQLQRIELVDQKPQAEDQKKRKHKQRAYPHGVVNGVALITRGARRLVLVHANASANNCKQNGLEKQKRAPRCTLLARVRCGQTPRRREVALAGAKTQVRASGC